MLKIIEPSQRVLKCIEPRLKSADQDYSILSLSEFVQTCKLEFGTRNSNAVQFSADRYWLCGSNLLRGTSDIMMFSQIEEKVHWLNDPVRMWRLQNYIYQLKLAENAGFQIPKTILSTDEAELSLFKQTHSIELTSPHIHEDQRHGTPHIYRETFSGGNWIRVYMFGTDVCALYLGEFHEGDYHETSLKHEDPSFWVMPDATLKSAKRFIRLSQLEFGIIDLYLSSIGQVFWLNFSTDTQILTRDDEAFPGAKLCSQLASFLTKSFF